MGRLAAYEEALDEDEDEQIGKGEETDIIKHLQEQALGKRYDDSTFPASKASLYRSFSTQPDYDVGAGEIRWMRPHDITQSPVYFNDEMGTYNTMIPGRLDDAWLLGALAMVAAHPDGLIDNLFCSEPDDFKKYGVYTCRFYVNGEWQYIVADSRIPCVSLAENQDRPPSAMTHFLPMYGRGSDLDEIWVPLIEKAYAKLHGTYEALNGGSVGEALVDLTGGSLTKISLREERVETMASDGRLWDELAHYLQARHIVACALEDPERKGFCGSDSMGIPINAACSIVSMKTISGFRLVRVRSPWKGGGWNGDWGSSSLLWEDYPEVYTVLSTDPELPWWRDINDNTFWMSFGDFNERFTRLYVCRTFPDPSARQYCMHGEWAGKTAGGAPKGTPGKGLSAEQKAGQSKMKDNLRRTSLVDVKADGDPYWFNNPQYRLRVDHPTEVTISLMQQDRRITSNQRDYHPIAFEVLRAKRHSHHVRLWERCPTDMVADSTTTLFASTRSEREVSVANLTLDPRFAYNIVPHPLEREREGKFTLRIFSSSDVIVEPVAETYTHYLRGSWDRSSERDTAGGPLRLVDDNKGVKSNPKWCQNPQFWLSIPPTSSYDTVDVKVVLRRVQEGGASRLKPGASKSAAPPRRTSLTHNALMGVVICKAGAVDTAPPRRHQHQVRTNALGEPVKGKKSTLKRAARHWQQPSSPTTSAKPISGVSDVLAAAGAGVTAEEGSGVSLIRKANGGKLLAGLPDRKISVSPSDWCQMSEYGAADASTTTLLALRRDWMPHGLFLVPTLSEKGVKGSFTLEVHSDRPVEVQELPETVSRTIAAEWVDGGAGGCHMHPDWRRNPCFHLRMHAAGPATVRIVLSRPEKDWRAACTLDSLGCMMGFYLLHGPRPVRSPGSILYDGKPWDESPFVPTHSVSTPVDFVLDSAGPDDVFTIMPATFNPAKVGPFFLSVTADREFSLKRDRGDRSEGESTSKKHGKDKEKSSHGSSTTPHLTHAGGSTEKLQIPKKGTDGAPLAHDGGEPSEHIVAEEAAG